MSNSVYCLLHHFQVQNQLVSTPCRFHTLSASSASRNILYLNSFVMTKYLASCRRASISFFTGHNPFFTNLQKGINWNSKVKFIAFRRMYETTRSTDPTEEKSKLVCYPCGDLLSQTLKWAVNSRCILLPALSMIWIRQSQCSWCEELHLLQDTELNFVIRQLNSGTVIITDYVLIKVFTYSCCCRLHWS